MVLLMESSTVDIKDVYGELLSVRQGRKAYAYVYSLRTRASNWITIASYRDSSAAVIGKAMVPEQNETIQNSSTNSLFTILVTRITIILTFTKYLAIRQLIHVHKEDYPNTTNVGT